jgi:hypothetical protein
MRRAEVIGTGVLVLFLAVSVPVWTQQGDQNRGQQQHGQQAKPAGHGQQHQQPGHQGRASQQHARGARPAGHVRPAQPTRVAQRRGGYHGRIPATRFRANFGAAHRFHMNRMEVVGGHRRFYYGGYWFVIPGPWPGGWAYTNNFYITYVNGGYYLCNPQYPGTQIVINIVL